MKRWLGFLCVAAVLLSSCKLPITHQGYIKFVIRPAASKSLGADFASSHSDFYTFLAYNSDRVVALSTTDVESDSVITVPVGSYNVVVLAGNDSEGSAIALLGSGSASGVAVVENATSIVSVDLHSIDFELTGPSTVPAGSEYTANMKFDTNSPVVACMYPGDIRLSDGSDHHITGAFSGDNGYSHFEGGVTLTAAGAPGAEVLKYESGSVFIIDDSVGRNFAVYSVSDNWTLPSWYFPDPAVSGIARFPFNIVQGAQGIQVIATWAD